MALPYIHNVQFCLNEVLRKCCFASFPEDKTSVSENYTENSAEENIFTDNLPFTPLISSYRIKVNDPKAWKNTTFFYNVYSLGFIFRFSSSAWIYACESNSARTKCVRIIQLSETQDLWIEIKLYDRNSIGPVIDQNCANSSFLHRNVRKSIMNYK